MSFKEAALAYARDGWSVIPLRPGKKSPQTEWASYIDERASEAQIEAWWDRWPNANVGLVMGPVSGACAVDVDEGDPSTVYKDAPCKMIQRTPRGFHLIYKHPGYKVLTRAGVKPGIDVRGDGGYIVAAPSVVDGHEYMWQSRCSIGELSDPPLFIRGQVPEEEEIRHDPKDDKWLTRLLAGVAEGQRNQALIRIAGYYAGKGIPRDVTMAMAGMWSARLSSPLSHGEIERTVRSAYDTANRNKRDVMTSYDTVMAADYISQYREFEESWLIQDWLPEATTGLITGAPGSYKTWLEIEAAVAVASGRPFLDNWEVRQGPVMMIQIEDAHPVVAQRLQIVVARVFDIPYDEETDRPIDSLIDEAVKDMPLHLPRVRTLRMDDRDLMEKFRERIAYVKPALVLIDPLYLTVPTENYMAEAATYLKTLKDMRDEFGTSFMVVHHNRKTPQDMKGRDKDMPLDRESTHGSQFINAWRETGWAAFKPPGSRGMVEIDRILKNVMDPNRIAINLPYATVGGRVSLQVTNEEAVTNHDAVWNILRRDGPIGYKHIAKNLGMRQETVQEILRELRAASRAETTAKGWHAIEIAEPETNQEMFHMEET